MRSFVTPFAADTAPLEAPEVASLLAGTRCLPTGKRGRPRKWQPTLVTEADQQRMTELESKYGSDDKTAKRVRDEYLAFCFLNQLPAVKGLGLVVGQWSNSGLGEGTCNTYLSYLSPLFPGESRSIFRRWKKIVALMHADADTRVTADALDGELEALMRRVTSCCDPSLSAMCYLLCLTGARCRDLARLRRRQIRVDISGKKRAKLIIQFRITKVRRSRWLRITIPFAFSLFGVFPDATILSYLSEGPRDQRLFAHFYNASSFNGCITKYCVERTFTVKSMRRGFINRMLARYPGDYDRVRRHTGHFRESTVRAFYEAFNEEN